MDTSIAKFEHISAKIKIENLSDDINFSEGLADKIIDGLGLKEVKRIEHKFSSVGSTLVCILSQSHLAIHTWPESKMLHIDLVSCAGTKIEDFDKVLSNSIAPYEISDYKSKLHSL